MAARPRAYQYQPVHAGIQRFAGMAQCRYVLEYLAAPAMYGVDNVIGRAQAGDDKWDLVFGAYGQVFLPPVVGLVTNVLDVIGRDGTLGLALFPFCSSDERV